MRIIEEFNEDNYRYHKGDKVLLRDGQTATIEYFKAPDGYIVTIDGDMNNRYVADYFIEYKIRNLENESFSHKSKKRFKKINEDFDTDEDELEYNLTFDFNNFITKWVDEWSGNYDISYSIAKSIIKDYIENMGL